ncbi:hypothetical protein DFH06DRAFT_107107 [Mycena polygramma]|nr:hypothetical protein DFH06DRAFT_239261 [Mycena polygramma]KAJ7616847.1 hypothetical protein DFH06DRAFT_107107 [Mycena polygramma]
MKMSSTAASSPDRPVSAALMTDMIRPELVDAAYDSGECDMLDIILGMPLSHPQWDNFVSVEDLLILCEEVFTSQHVNLIRKYYENLDLDVSLVACVATYRSVIQSLLLEVLQSSANWPPAKTPERGTGGESSAVQPLSSGTGVDSGRGDGGSRAGRGGRGGRGNASRGVPRPVAARAEHPEGARFRAATRSTITVVPPATPRGQESRNQSLEEIALRLASTSVLQSLGPLYDPTESETGMDAATRRAVVHGTRSSALPSFMDCGVYPVAGVRPNMLVDGPAFYTSSSPILAYLHALVVQPRVLPSSADSICLLVFQISPLRLHGTDSDDPAYTCSWFPAESQDEINELVQHATECILLVPYPYNVISWPRTDADTFVIAPHILPTSTAAGARTVCEPTFAFLPAGTLRPAQIATATTEGWKYLNECIDLIIVEEREERQD